MITHDKAVVFTNIKNLDFAAIMRHNIAIGLLYAAQLPVDIVNNLYASAKRHLEMRGALHRPRLKEIVRPHTE